MYYKNLLFKVSLLFNIIFILVMINKELLHGVKRANETRMKEVGFATQQSYKYDKIFYNFPKKTDIVMLGDSLTANAEWDELLGRADVANRGLVNDKTEGFFNRLDRVYKLQPSICFVMGGINDLIGGKSVDEVLGNIEKIAEKLKQHNITPIIQSTLFIRGSVVINSEVLKLDKLLREYCNKNAVAYLDLNRVLSKDNELIGEYTYDGMHLNFKGYKIWGAYLEPVLKGIDFK